MVKEVCFASFYAVQALDALLLLIGDVSLGLVGAFHCARLANSIVQEVMTVFVSKGEVGYSRLILQLKGRRM